MLHHNVVHTQGVQMMYIGSLMVALAVEESGLHRRIALNALSLAVKISENCWQPLVCCLVFFCGKDTYLNDVTVENFLTPRERVQPTWCSGSCFPPPSSPCGSATPPPLPWWSLCFVTLKTFILIIGADYSSSPLWTDTWQVSGQVWVIFMKIQEQKVLLASENMNILFL